MLGVDVIGFVPEAGGMAEQQGLQFGGQVHLGGQVFQIDQVGVFGKVRRFLVQFGFVNELA